MAAGRYLFELKSNPDIKRSMRIGLIGEAELYNQQHTSRTIDGVVYTITQGYFGNHVQRIWKNNGWTWNSGDGQSAAWWQSNDLELQITATGTEPPGKRPSIQINNVRLKGIPFNVTIGQAYGSDQTFTMGLLALYGNIGDTPGVFLTVTKSSDAEAALPANNQYMFIPDAFFDMAEPEIPYDPNDTENADGTPDGGYAEGEANIGTVTPGTVPTHPLASSSVGIHVYRLGGSALASFVGKMWGAGGASEFENLWQKWKNYKFNPMAGIISCHALPSEFMPTGAVSNAVSIAGTTISDIAGQSTGGQVIEQRYTADMTAYFHWNNFLDYTNAVFIAHVPFCGECEIPAVNCVGGSVLFVYRCDIMTGNVACWICPTDSRGNTQQIACLTGNCAYILPVTGNDNGMGEIIGAVKTSIGNALQYHYGANMSANMGGIGAGLSAGYSGSMSARPALDILTARSNTQVAGNLAGSVALVANNHLFLDVKFANPSYPDYMLSARGTASDTGGLVSKFTGHYVEFADVHADGIAGATREEKAMIENALLSGVYV